MKHFMRINCQCNILKSKEYNLYILYYIIFVNNIIPIVFDLMGLHIL